MRRRILFVGALVLVAACGERAPERRGGPVTVQDVPAAADVPLPGSVYEAALERAKREITAENAKERLNAIERAIDEGK